MRSRSKAATFITWDGPEQNYLESLFLPIFGRMEDQGFDFSVLQFAWGDGLRRISTLRAATRLGIGYEVHKIFRRPLRPATVATMLLGAARIVAHARARDTDVLIPRSIIPAAMTLLARPRLPNVRIVYDSDGFVADERVEFDGWNGQGMTYRVFRAVEDQICRIADSVITRSENAAHLLTQRVGDELNRRDLYVVPNGKEPTVFQPGTKERRNQVRRQLGLDEHTPMLVYAGSLGERYLPVELFRFFAAVRHRRSDSHLVVLTSHQDLARRVAKEVGTPARSFTLKFVSPERVPSYLAAGDLGICFRKNTFSQQCVCPIKLAEYLLCGLPVIVTTGVGDVDHQVTEAEGIVLSDVTPRTLENAADEFFERIFPHRQSFRKQCRQTGMQYFALENTARGYREAIEKKKEQSSRSLANRSANTLRNRSCGRWRPYASIDSTISRYIVDTFRL